MYDVRIEFEFREKGSDAAGATRTFMLAVRISGTEDAWVRVVLSGHVELSADDVPRGVSQPQPPIYLVVIELPWKTQGQRLASARIEARHVLGLHAGEWLLVRTNYYVDGQPVQPSTRARRALSLERHLPHVEAALRYGKSVQLRYVANATRQELSSPAPHEQITTLADIAFVGWGVNLPHVNRGRRPTVDPDDVSGDRSTVLRRRKRIAARQI